MTEYREPTPVVTPSRAYSGSTDGGVYIENIYSNRHSDTGYLFDPADPPHEVASDQISPIDLYLTKDQARQLRDRLNALNLG